MLSINIQDVLNVLSSVKNHLIVLGVALVVALVALVAFKALPVAKRKLARSSALVALGLVVVIVVNTICFGPMFTMINLAMGGGAITEESMAEAYDVNTELVSEGVTLLENNGALPLSSGANVNVCGWASTAPVYGGVGSGALNDQYAVTDLITGLKNAGLNVNQDLVDFYEAYQAERPSVGMWAQDWTLPEPNVNAYTDEMMTAAKEFPTPRWWSSPGPAVRTPTCPPTWPPLWTAAGRRRTPPPATPTSTVLTTTPSTRATTGMPATITCS